MARRDQKPEGCKNNQEAQKKPASMKNSFAPLF
jgi:hypothetical protein